MPYYIGLRDSQNYTINPITLLNSKTNGLVNKVISLEGSNSPSYVSPTNFNIKKLQGYNQPPLEASHSYNTRTALGQRTSTLIHRIR